MLEIFPEEHLFYSDADGGCTVNISDDVVLLRRPDRIDLPALWKEFVQTLRQELRTLFVTEYGKVMQQYSGLNFQEGHREQRSHKLYGLISRGTDNRLHILKNPPVVQALIKLQIIPPLTPHGRPRTRIPRESGTVTEVLTELSGETHVKVIDLVLGNDLDAVLRFSQRDTLGLAALKRAMLTRTLNPVGALRLLLDEMERNIAPVQVVKGASNAKGTGRSYAAIWFSQFLAARGVWLFPFQWFDRLLAFWPDHLRPLLLTMSVPAHSRDIADGVLSTVSRDLTSLRNTPHVFAISALCSTMWSERRFCPTTLIFMKTHFGTSDRVRSSSINHVYKVLASQFDIDVLERSEARLLDGRKRVSSTMAFRWVDRPEKSNLKRVSRILKQKWSDVVIPEHTRMLAAEIRELLPTFKVQNMRDVRDAVELFLIFTLFLSEDRAISRLRDIRRDEHVRSESNPHETFFEFLQKHFSDLGSHSARASFSKMCQLWKAGALRDGYDKDTPCPFDPVFDRLPSKGNVRGRAGRAIEQEVIDILIELNLKDDYGFARSLGWYDFNVKDATTGLYSSVFWPAVAIAVDISLRTGHRLRSIRWLDSGEGDERWYDPITMTDQPNTLACAVNGRRMSAIRLIQLDDDKRTKVNAMYLCVAKGGGLRDSLSPNGTDRSDMQNARPADQVQSNDGACGIG